MLNASQYIPRPHHQSLPPLRARYENDPQAQAAHRLFTLCARHVGDSTSAIAEFLVGLYNRRYASGDPAWLCKWTDDKTFDDVVATMRWIRANSQYEIHNIFAGDGGETMRVLMQRFGLWPLEQHSDSDRD
jgi:hypothetical protein